MSLNYFVGKPCTIITVGINFRFKEEPMMDYFSGILTEFDENGIVIEHFKTKCKNYIFLKYIVSVTEEQILYEDEPEHAKIIEEYRKEKPITAARTTVKSPFIDPKALAELATKHTPSV